MDWPLAPDHPPRAAVSAFALSGTNAHVVVEGYGAPEDASVSDAERRSPAGSAQTVAVSLPESVAESPTEEGLRPRRTRLLPLSAKSDEALRELAGRYISWLDKRAGALSSEDAAESVLSDMTWTAGVGRSHFKHRAGRCVRRCRVVAGWIKVALGVRWEPRPPAATKVAFAYTGEGGHWVGMGEELYESEPVARAVLDRCDEVLRVERDASLLDVMLGRSGDLDDPAWTQPAVFALECALTTLWSSIGIRPGVVFGTGLGEIAAAHAAGVFTLEEGLRFAARRGALMEALSGDKGVETALNDLEAALKGVVTPLPSLTLVNQVTGRMVPSGETLDGAYWRRQAREPVAFGGCVKALTELGVEVVVEIGPDVVLGPRVVSAWQEPVGDARASGENAGTPVVLASQRRPSEDTPQSGRAFVEAVAGCTRRGSHSTLPGCSRERHAAASRCRDIPSNGGASGSRRPSSHLRSRFFDA